MKKNTFTLTELAAVLSLSVIAIGLLCNAVPAGKAKEYACAGNERQLGMILVQYASDNDGYLPYPIGNDYRAPFSWVVTLYRSKLISGVNKDLSFAEKNPDNAMLTELCSLLKCPEAGPQYPDNEMQGWWDTKSGSSADYGINCYFSTSDQTGNKGNFGGSIRMNDCKEPAKSVMLADAAAKQFYKLYGGTNAVVLRHNDGEGINLLMGDGAVKLGVSLTEEQIRFGVAK